MEDPNCFKGSSIQNLKSDLFDLKNKVELRVIEERKAVIVEVKDMAAKIAQMPDFQALDADNKVRITARIDNHKADLDAVTLIPMLRDLANGARTNLLSDVVTELDRLARPVPAPTQQHGMSDRPAPAPQVPTTVLASQLKVNVPKTLLANEADVDQYLNEMKKTLLAEIAAGKKVIV